jgi:hypothetical protein
MANEATETKKKPNKVVPIILGMYYLLGGAHFRYKRIHILWKTY